MAASVRPQRRNRRTSFAATISRGRLARMAHLRMRTVSSQQRFAGGEHPFRSQQRHAAMIERADALLAGAARYILLQMNGLCVVGLGPRDVRRAKERHDRLIECGGEMARTAVRGNE